MGNTFGNIFRVTTFGESHGPAVGAVVDGCPARLRLKESDIQKQLDRRRPGQSNLTTSRSEADRVRILSGVEKGLTLGSPIALAIENTNVRAGDYSELSNIPRPSHADFTYRIKYGILASSGGGRASARETAARVAAGAIAEKFLRDTHGVEIVARVSSVGMVCEEGNWSLRKLTRAQVDASKVRCPEKRAAEAMIRTIENAASAGDSIGGAITCVCRNVPAGWGEPVFDKIGAVLGHAMLSIPAVKAFEIGAGFAGSTLNGSLYNDMFTKKGRRIGTVTNRSGGIQGGITNGEPLVMRVFFRPPATIRRPQKTVDYNGRPVTLKITKGRHDPCIVPRAVPVVEAMAALALADMALLAAANGA